LAAAGSGAGPHARHDRDLRQHARAVAQRLPLRHRPAGRLDVELPLHGRRGRRGAAARDPRRRRPRRSARRAVGQRDGRLRARRERGLDRHTTRPQAQHDRDGRAARRLAVARGHSRLPHPDHRSHLMTSTTATPDTAVEPRVDRDVVNAALDGRWAELRRQSRDLFLDPDLRREPGLSMEEHRERVLGQLRKMVELGAVQRAFPESVGGQNDHGGSLARFEEVAVGDPSLQIKAGVQWGLFASAIMHLGTERHHRTFLPGAVDLSVPGAFAMTEIGHGSDVASIGTTATADPETEEFVLHTPFRAAWKDYLGNAALHGVAAVVFAQLITKGVNHGVHAFYVPLRDTSVEVPEGEPFPFLPGIQGEDDGLKGGLNGIDNGRLAFDHVRIPRTNLLNRYGDVAPDGTYSSPIKSPGRRFFTMLGTLVQGRVSLDGSAGNAAKMGLAIAVRYGNERRQFTGASDTTETGLLDYRRHQRRLIPLIAETY